MIFSLRARHLGRTSVVLAVAMLWLVGLAQGAIPYPKRPSNTGPIERLRKGEAEVDAKNKELISEMARWLVDRLVHPPYNGEELKQKAAGYPEDLESLFEEVQRIFPVPPPAKSLPNKNQLDYARELAKEMSAELLYVMKETQKPLEQINCARMMAFIGKLPYPELADIYVSFLREDKYPEAIKFFAFQGLKNLLSISDPFNPGGHIIYESKAGVKLQDIFAELDKFITKKYPQTISPSDALVRQFLRREAIRAMAQFKSCQIIKERKVLGKPLWTLIRVARNDQSIMPGYGFSNLERIEALIGILSMKPERDVNIDAVAWLVNETFYDLISWVGDDRTEVKMDPRFKPAIAWRSVGNRLNEAMKLWKANLEYVAPERKKPAMDLADIAVPKLLSVLESKGIDASPEIRSFDSWRTDRKPKEAKVIANDASTAFNVP